MNQVESNNPLSEPLTKRWFVLRHGRSEANEAGIVASRLANAGTAWGLTEAGRAQVTASVREQAAVLRAEPPLLLLTSPFLRTLQTAEITGNILEVPPQTEARLVERDFGDFELLSDAHYKEAWAADRSHPMDVPGGTETVYEVADRLAGLILDVDRNHDVRTCLLVTHCDVAMILSCVFQNLDPRHHRSLDPIKTGEIRRLHQAAFEDPSGIG